jgi:hypothetical protein
MSRTIPVPKGLRGLTVRPPGYPPEKSLVVIYTVAARAKEGDLAVISLKPFTEPIVGRILFNGKTATIRSKIDSRRKRWVLRRDLISALWPVTHVYEMTDGAYL